VELKSFGIMQLNLVFLFLLHRPGNGVAHLIGPDNGPLACNDGLETRSGSGSLFALLTLSACSGLNLRFPPSCARRHGNFETGGAEAWAVLAGVGSETEKFCATRTPRARALQRQCASIRKVLTQHRGLGPGQASGFAGGWGHRGEKGVGNTLVQNSFLKNLGLVSRMG
jgi:hypothetical protein